MSDNESDYDPSINTIVTSLPLLAGSEWSGCYIEVDLYGNVFSTGDRTSQLWSHALTTLSQDDYPLSFQARSVATGQVKSRQISTKFIDSVETKLKSPDWRGKKWQGWFTALWTVDRDEIWEALAKAMEVEVVKPDGTRREFNDYEHTEIRIKMMRYSHAIYDSAGCIPDEIYLYPRKTKATPELVNFLQCLKPTWDADL